MKSGLEVFDFNEGDELPDFAADRFLGKFKNPSLGDPAILKPELLERASQGAAIENKESRTDANEGDNPHYSSSNGTAPSSLEIDRENSATQDATAGPGAAWKSQSPTQEYVPCSNMDTFKSECSFTEVEARFSGDEAPSPGKFRSTCALVASPLNSELVNEKLGADGIDESSPSSSISNIAVNDGIFDGCSSHKVFSAPEMLAINIAVDYVSYRDNYRTGCMVQFFPDGIKISGGEQEKYFLERGINDIIRIESQQLRRSGTVSVKLHFLPKDAAQDVHADGVELLEFALVEPNWSGKFEEITSLNAKYLAVYSILWDTDFSMDGGSVILRRTSYFPKFDEAVEDVVYPKGDSDAVSVSKRDFDLLQPETFVNDTIIDFYIKYLKNQIPAGERHRFHFFNSFFFRKLADLDKDPSSVSDGRAAFLRVHKWTRKVDIFGKDYIFIPVNFSLHWSLLVICHPAEVADFKDADLGKAMRVPCILHMDSIKGTHAGLKNLVQSYLWEEWKERHKDTSDDISTRFLNMRFVPLELPQQENSFDCGLFLLHYLELFLAEGPPNFSPFKINKSSNFLTVDWFHPAEASLKRTLIQRLISGLLDNHTRELSFPDRSDEPDPCFPQNNMNESAVQLVSERCISAVACHGEVSSCDANQGIEITLLQSSSRNVDCVSDSGLVLRELFEPGVAEGSLIAQCPSFVEPSYFCHNGAMSQQVEDVDNDDDDDDENEEEFAYFSSGNSIPFTLAGYGANPSWKQRENDVFPRETSAACASDDSDVGIIENCAVQKDEDLFQGDGVDKQASQSTEKTDSLAGAHASICNEDLKSTLMEITNENSNFSFCQEDVAMGFKMLENGLHQQSEAEINSGHEKQSNGSDMVAESEKQGMEGKLVTESDEKQAMEGNMVNESEEKQALEGNMVNESEEKQAMEGNMVTESDEKQAMEGNMVNESEEKQSMEGNMVNESEEKQAMEGNMVTGSDNKESNVILGSDEKQSIEEVKLVVELDKKHTMEDINLKRECDEMQTIQDSNVVVAGSDDRTATKRQRVTLTDEGEDLTGNMSEDLHS